MPRKASLPIPSMRTTTIQYGLRIQSGLRSVTLRNVRSRLAAWAPLARRLQPPSTTLWWSICSRTFAPVARISRAQSRSQSGNYNEFIAELQPCASLRQGGRLLAHRRRVLIAANRAAHWVTSAIAVGRRVIADGAHTVTECEPAIVVMKRHFYPYAFAFSAGAAWRRLPHHSATAKEYCPSSSTVARQ